MKKSFLVLFLVLALFIPLNALASGNHYIFDNACLLAGQELDMLEIHAQEISDQYQIDIVILTVDSLNGNYVRDYADDYYDNGGFRNDGILFLLAMTEREWYISTSGSVIDLISDYEIDQLAEAALSDLSYGYYYDGFEAYLNALPRCLKASSVPSTASTGNNWGGILLISLLIGAVTAGICLLIMRSTMNTKRKQRSANNYMKQDSFHLTVQQDIFLYSHVDKTPRQQNTSSSGSSVHSSSSGRSHGGHGGRF